MFVLVPQCLDPKALCVAFRFNGCRLLGGHQARILIKLYTDIHLNVLYAHF